MFLFVLVYASDEGPVWIESLAKIWQVKVKVVPVVVGALGTISKSLGKHLDEIGTNVRVELLQKAALLGTARTLRKTLEI